VFAIDAFVGIISFDDDMVVIDYGELVWWDVGHHLNSWTTSRNDSIDSYVPFDVSKDFFFLTSGVSRSYVVLIPLWFSARKKVSFQDAIKLLWFFRLRVYFFWWFLRKLRFC